MKFLHAMVRVRDLEEALDFYGNKLGLKVLRRRDYPEWKCTLAYLAAREGEAEIELTYNWEPEEYTGGRNFGHLAFAVENIYETCQALMEGGVRILRPPRDGKMAFIRSPDGISIELLQEGCPLEPEEPWKSMPNQGVW